MLRRTTTPRAGALVALAMATALLAGCTTDEEPRELEIGGSDTASATPSSPSAAPDDQTDPAVPQVSRAPAMGEKAAEEHGVHALTLPEDDEARVVGQTVVDYMALRVETYHTRKFDLDAMARLAQGQPLTGVQGWVPELEKRGVHTVGHVWLEIEDSDVTIKKRRATFRDVCAPNSTVDVDDQSIAREEASPSYVISGSAYRVADDVWLIDEFTIETKRCRTKS